MAARASNTTSTSVETKHKDDAPRQRCRCLPPYADGVQHTWLCRRSLAASRRRRLLFSARAAGDSLRERPAETALLIVTPDTGQLVVPPGIRASDTPSTAFAQRTPYPGIGRDLRSTFSRDHTASTKRLSVSSLYDGPVILVIYKSRLQTPSQRKRMKEASFERRFERP